MEIDDIDNDPRLNGKTGQDYVDTRKDIMAEKAAEEALAQAPSGPIPVQAPQPSSPSRRALNDLKNKEREEAEEAEAAAELQRYKNAQAFAKAHPILVGTAGAIKKIVGKGADTVSTKSAQFIKDQDTIHGKKSSKKSKKKSEEFDFGEDDEDETPTKSRSGRVDWISERREYGGGSGTSSLPASAYRPSLKGKGAPFQGEYQSAGVPTTYSFGGARKPSADDMMAGMKGIKGGMMLPGGKKGKTPMPMLDDHMGSSNGDNSGMGEYKPIGNPITLRNRGGLYIGDTRNVPVPNSLQGITIGGTGPRGFTIPKPVMPQQSVTMPQQVQKVTLPPPPPLMQKKKVNK